MSYWKEGCPDCEKILSESEKRNGVRVCCRSCNTRWICDNKVFVIDSNSKYSNGEFYYPCPT